MRHVALRSILFSAVLGLAAWRSADAQTVTRPFSDLGRYLEPGDTVFVVERARGETRGTLERLSATSLVLRVDGTTERYFGVEDVGWIERFPDPVWDGALWSGVFGYASTLGLWEFLCASYPDNTAADCAGSLVSAAPQRLAVKFAGIYAGLGLLIDMSQRERWLVYGTRPGPARRQFRTPRPIASLDELWSRVRPGDAVYLRETSGRETKGTFSRASESSVTMVVDQQPRDIPADQVLRISRRTSQMWLGMVIGPLVSAAYGASNPAQYSSRGETAVAGAALGWALGTIIGSALPGRMTIYGTETPPAISLMPVLAPSRTGVMLSVSF